MPFSAAEGKSFLMGIYRSLRARISDGIAIDIGCGSGTYAKNLKGVSGKIEWYGIEAWAPYIDFFRLHSYYDRVFAADARFFDYSYFGSIDFAFLGDVIEHMERDESFRLVHTLLDFGATCFIQIPLSVHEQGSVNNNPFEIHRDLGWNHRVFLGTFPECVCYRTLNGIGAYVLTKNNISRNWVCEAMGTFSEYQSSERDFCERLCLEYPEDPDLSFEFAKILLNNEEVDGFFKEISRCATIGRKSAELDVLYCKGNQFLGMHKNAIEGFEKILSDYGYCFDAYAGLGEIYLKCGMLKKAENILSVAKVHYPTHPVLRYLLSRVWHRQGLLTAALAEAVSAEILSSQYSVYQARFRENRKAILVDVNKEYNQDFPGFCELIHDIIKGFDAPD